MLRENTKFIIPTTIHVHKCQKVYAYNYQDETYIDLSDIERSYLARTVTE